MRNKSSFFLFSNHFVYVTKKSAVVSTDFFSRLALIAWVNERVWPDFVHYFPFVYGKYIFGT